ncbi:uncharacterized protein LAESUDRAFT_190473 [Laetiporus sulphureus 93-53]|uniref:DUF6533 domain-containing protein n=1 Tax=Laetiporus sulphureus 93-53 TaxID=1314785 RepID=A0A165E6C0_9APHY|nr:uncharacterized protein LAESUDRAFT_190473 [Laetiporus sulphureus 93-53]KZT06319.1 hypothetical protein LAESUDRAFT_190473 [Laetiporus sulphureus 93-53]
MSSSSYVALLTVENISILQEAAGCNYRCVAVAALIFYEHIILLSDEISMLRLSRLTFATLLYLLNRFMLVLLGVTYVLSIFWWDTPLVCESVGLLQRAQRLLSSVFCPSYTRHWGLRIRCTRRRWRRRRGPPYRLHQQAIHTCR